MFAFERGKKIKCLVYPLVCPTRNIKLYKLTVFVLELITADSYKQHTLKRGWKGICSVHCVRKFQLKYYKNKGIDGHYYKNNGIDGHYYKNKGIDG